MEYGETWRISLDLKIFILPKNIYILKFPVFQIETDKIDTNELKNVYFLRNIGV